VTQDELQVAYDFYLARQAGLAGGVKPEYLPAAHRLFEKGWLSRRIQDDQVVFEFTEQGVTALNLDALSDYVANN
jgi:hypothetical protein